MPFLAWAKKRYVQYINKGPRAVKNAMGGIWEVGTFLCEDEDFEMVQNSNEVG